MEVGKVYRSKELKNFYLRVEEVKADGWLGVSFNHKSLKPNIFNYHQAYVDTYYEPVPEEGNS